MNENDLKALADDQKSSFYSQMNENIIRALASLEFFFAFLSPKKSSRTRV